ncbi:MAG: DUF2461 domain-containing protein [Actinomycetota bacterium]
MSSTAAFTGLPIEGMEFYEALGADNSKTFWQVNKHRYDDHVKAPMRALAESLDEYGPFHVFRPHNDLRFAKNKPPYKTAQGMYGELEGGAGYYVQFSADGLMVGAGYYSMAKDQLDRFRQAVVADATGEELAALVADAERKKLTATAISELKTAPRGYDKQHPRIELIRRKGLILTTTVGSPKWIHTKAAAGRIRELWERARPVCDWLDAHVGPSTMPPDDRPF